MPARVRITGKSDRRNTNDSIDAQVDSLGNLMCREGVYPGLMETYEDTSFVTGDSPATLDFNADAGRNSTDGYCINDGAGDFYVDYSRDGITFSDKATIKVGERLSLLRLDIDKLRITWIADSSYRVVMI